MLITSLGHLHWRSANRAFTSGCTYEKVVKYYPGNFSFAYFLSHCGTMYFRVDYLSPAYDRREYAIPVQAQGPSQSKVNRYDTGFRLYSNQDITIV